MIRCREYAFYLFNQEQKNNIKIKFLLSEHIKVQFQVHQVQEHVLSGCNKICENATIIKTNIGNNVFCSKTFKVPLTLNLSNVQTTKNLNFISKQILFMAFSIRPLFSWKNKLRHFDPGKSIRTIILFEFKQSSYIGQDEIVYICTAFETKLSAHCTSSNVDRCQNPIFFLVLDKRYRMISNNINWVPQRFQISKTMRNGKTSTFYTKRNL